MATNKAVVFPELRDTYSQLMTEEQKVAFEVVRQWADSLTTELTSRLIEEQARESIRVARVDNTSNLTNPQSHIGGNQREFKICQMVIFE